jgi:phytanoyl-CoA hydroxylase
MIDKLRRLKLSYAVYNFFHKQQLLHNVEKYRKIGLKKKYYSSISSRDFENVDPNLLKKDVHVPVVTETSFFKNSDADLQKHILEFDKTGYIVVPSYLSHEKADAANQEIDRLLTEKKVSLNSVNKIMFAFHHSKLLESIGNSAEIIEFLSSLAKGNIKLFQSINFLMGSQQKTHSDSIHMTTFPEGGLIAIWIALEDIDESNGALHYYPGSHTLPYYLNKDYNNEGTALFLGNSGYHQYEQMLQDKVKELQLEKKIFRAKKGDMLIWHANLLHGGESHPDRSKTRKSMVFHYYDVDCICYHEISQRPTLME